MAKKIKKGEKIETMLTIYLSLYKRTVVVFFNSTLDRVIEAGIKNGIEKHSFSDEWKKEVEPAFKSANGFCAHYGEDSSDILICIKKRPTKASEFDTLYHEIYHAVDTIAKHIDPENSMTDKTGNSEARAYLYGYIATECNKILWNKK